MHLYCDCWYLRWISVLFFCNFDLASYIRFWTYLSRKTAASSSFKMFVYSSYVRFALQLSSWNFLSTILTLTCWLSSSLLLKWYEMVSGERSVADLLRSSSVSFLSKEFEGGYDVLIKFAVYIRVGGERDDPRPRQEACTVKLGCLFMVLNSISFEFAAGSCVINVIFCCSFCWTILSTMHNFGSTACTICAISFHFTMNSDMKFPILHCGTIWSDTYYGSVFSCAIILSVFCYLSLDSCFVSRSLSWGDLARFLKSNLSSLSFNFSS